MVKYVLDAIDEADGQSLYSSECENLNFGLMDLRNAVYEMSETDYETIKNELLNMRTNANVAVDNKSVLAKALTYLEFYKSCQVDRDDYDQIKEFDNSDWKDIVNPDDKWEDLEPEFLKDAEKVEMLKLHLLAMELKFAYDLILKKIGGAKVVLSSLDSSELGYNLVSSKYARYMICGPVSAEENDCKSGNKLKAKDGKNYGGYGRRYDLEAYELLKENCAKATDYYRYIYRILFRKIDLEGREKFKGIFFEYTKEEVEQMCKKMMSIASNSRDQMIKCEKEMDAKIASMNNSL